MIKFCVFSIFLLLPFLFSCTGTPPPQSEEVCPTCGALLPQESDEISLPQQQEILPSQQQEALPPQQIAVAAIPQRPVVTPPERTDAKYIMGKGRLDSETLSLFLAWNNPRIDIDYVRMLIDLYIEEAAYEGVDHDVAFVQMCLETGFLGFGGIVLPEWNNFCGLGAIGPEQPGLIFPDPRTGVRAHIQHLKAYASEEPLNNELINPRFRFVRRGSSPTIDGLAGTWAADRLYADKIYAILQRLYDFAL